jgi:hypothetical protein
MSFAEKFRGLFQGGKEGEEKKPEDKEAAPEPGAGEKEGSAQRDLRVGDTVKVWDSKEEKTMDWTLGPSRTKGLLSVFRFSPDGKQKFTKDILPTEIRPDDHVDLSDTKEAGNLEQTPHEYNQDDTVRVMSRSEKKILDWTVANPKTKDGKILIRRKLVDGTIGEREITIDEIVDDEVASEQGKMPEAA